MKLCIDCKHFWHGYGGAFCGRFDKEKEPDPVYGISQLETKTAISCRKDESDCGMDAKHFEEKEQK